MLKHDPNRKCRHIQDSYFLSTHVPLLTLHDFMTTCLILGLLPQITVATRSSPIFVTLGKNNRKAQENLVVEALS